MLAGIRNTSHDVLFRKMAFLTIVVVNVKRTKSSVLIHPLSGENETS